MDKTLKKFTKDFFCFFVQNNFNVRPNPTPPRDHSKTKQTHLNKNPITVFFINSKFYISLCLHYNLKELYYILDLIDAGRVMQ